MIQFFGLHVDATRATAVALGRDLAEWSRASVPVVNAREVAAGDARPQRVEIPPAEWVRAGAFALQEAYFELPVKSRKLWGLALSAPSGWIALDVNYEPSGPLHCLPAESVAADVATAFASDPRAAERTSVVLAPKDYLRFALSGALATDVTDVDRLGFLASGERWNEDAARAAGWRDEWLVPVFSSEAVTGRLSEDGVRQTSLPGGTWVVAGAHERDAEFVGVADLARTMLWRTRSPDTGDRWRFGVASTNDASAPSGWTRRRAAQSGYSTIERFVSGPDEDAARALDELRGAGFTVEEAIRIDADAPLGAAALAAVGSNLVRGWDGYHAKRAAAEPRD